MVTWVRLFCSYKRYLTLPVSEPATSPSPLSLSTRFEMSHNSPLSTTLFFCYSFNNPLFSEPSPHWLAHPPTRKPYWAYWLCSYSFPYHYHTHYHANPHLVSVSISRCFHLVVSFHDNSITSHQSSSGSVVAFSGAPPWGEILEALIRKVAHYGAAGS